MYFFVNFWWLTFGTSFDYFVLKKPCCAGKIQLCYLLHCLISCSISWCLNDARNSDNIRFCYNVHLLTFYQWWNRHNYSQYRLNLYFQLKLAKFTRFLGERQKFLSLRRESKLGRWHISLVVHEKVKKLVLYQ